MKVSDPDISGGLRPALELILGGFVRRSNDNVKTMSKNDDRGHKWIETRVGTKDETLTPWF